MGMWSRCAIAVFLLGLPVLCLQTGRADLIPVTIALAEDGLESPANLAAVSAIEFLVDPGAGPYWTTEANNILLGNILDLVTSLGGDSGEIAELFAPGAVFAEVLEPSVPLVFGSAPVSSFETSESIPEPATMGLLGGAMLLLSLYAMRRLRNIYLHGPPQRSD